MAYEDFETGTHAKRAYDFLVEPMGPDCEFTRQIRNFEALSMPTLRDTAIRNAVAADITIISGHGDELPGGVRTGSNPGGLRR
jgi:hypothetical protein